VTIEKNDKGVYQITDDNVDAATGDKKVSYFVKFFAPWCGHCKNMAADWESFASTNTDASLRVAECDCTTSAAACQKHGVRGYPTVVLFKNGEPVKFQGARNKAAFTEFWANNKPSDAKTEL
jgi:thioredoxin domain-containing protein 5